MHYGTLHVRQEQPFQLKSMVEKKKKKRRRRKKKKRHREKRFALWTGSKGLHDTTNKSSKSGQVLQSVVGFPLS